MTGYWLPMGPGSRLLATLLGLVALAGCGGESRERPFVSQQVEAPPDARAVELRAEIASLLGEDVFLISHAVRTGARVGFDSALYHSAEKQLEHATGKLVDKLSALFDDDLKDVFQRRLDRLVELVLGYGREQVAPGFADVPFRQEIDEHRAALTTILKDSSPALSEQDLAGHLELTLDELLLALDRVGLDRRGQLDHAEAAAHFSRGLAGVLAVAVAEDSPTIGDRGSPLTEPARIYADLRTLLEEDLHLSFAAVQVGLAEGFGSPLFRTSSLQVDESALLFADRFATIPKVGGTREVTIPDIADPTNRLPDEDFSADAQDDGEGPAVSHHRAVRDLLRRHWQFVALYARELSAENVDELTSKEIEKTLHTLTSFFADVLAAQTAVQRTSLAEPLHEADEELLKAIEALVREEPAAYEHLVKALDHVADAADVLTDGVIFIQVSEREPRP